MEGVRVLYRGGEGQEGAADEGDDVLPRLSAALGADVVHLVKDDVPGGGDVRCTLYIVQFSHLELAFLHGARFIFKMISVG